MGEGRWVSMGEGRGGEHGGGKMGVSMVGRVSIDHYRVYGVLIKVACLLFLLCLLYLLNGQLRGGVRHTDW